MKHNTTEGVRFFFSTALLPCPYLPGRVEGRVVTELVGRDVVALHDVLSLAGFRRSHSIAYAPACPDCEACVAVRVRAREFAPSRSQRRVWKRNAGVAAFERPPVATQEQYVLFAAYQTSRHGEGDMARMDFLDYQALIEDTPLETSVIEFRDSSERLIAACLADRVADGISAVYSFFDPDMARLSLGTHMILWIVERTREMGLPHAYLGYWVKECRKMSYKAAFQPLEGRTPGGWRPLPDQGAVADR